MPSSTQISCSVLALGARFFLRPRCLQFRATRNNCEKDVPCHPFDDSHDDDHNYRTDARVHGIGEWRLPGTVVLNCVCSPTLTPSAPPSYTLDSAVRS
ncbi:hypothetical protein LZ31DRAFT_120371 [Colletotrichum somersetense]|nr:hypothetical protein LZ31DRAFT_120371 [Colletotrichum somersetense]